MPGWVTTVLEESLDDLLGASAAVRRFRGEVGEPRDRNGAGGDDALVAAARRTAATLRSRLGRLGLLLDYPGVRGPRRPERGGWEHHSRRQFLLALLGRHRTPPRLIAAVDGAFATRRDLPASLELLLALIGVFEAQVERFEASVGELAAGRATAARRAALLASWSDPLAPADDRLEPFAIDLDALASSELLLAGIVACVVMRSPLAALPAPHEPSAGAHVTRRLLPRG